MEDALLSLDDIFDGGVEARLWGRLFAKFVTPDVLPAQDWETALQLLIASLQFEAKTLFQDGPEHMPCDIPSVRLWLGRRERAVVVDPASRLEAHFGDEVARMWQMARAMPAHVLTAMHGERGMTVVVRALLQWRAVDPDAADWAIIVADVVSGLEVLREKPADADFSQSLASLLLHRDAARANKAKDSLSMRVRDRELRVRAALDAKKKVTVKRGKRLRKRKTRKA
ncbi:unnamed protein product [Peniophora sp. CBMAI 1063]|nr:unnamed protein product [Peniophora sp. CBMAI 1063]